ncbi:MAG: hypothetical protein H6739_02005 [Alphaproteobacteria bacterium]|nr:hypothetical protein [Alphaproteobacteria bacterium]
MPEPIARALLIVAGAYLGLGAVFAVPFAARGVSAIDPAAEGSGWAFRALITPAVIALWPLLALRWARGVTVPVEHNAHLDAAGPR